MGCVTVTGHGLCNNYGYGLCDSYWMWAVLFTGYGLCWRVLTWAVKQLWI